VYVLGIAGPIAAGKTTVMGFFAESEAECISADDVSRQIMQPGSPVLSAIEREFGPAYFDAEGQLDRKALGRRVFSDPAALLRLNALTHPALRSAIEQRIESARRRANPPGMLIVEAAVMGEMGAVELLDGLVFVDAPDAVRVERLQRRDGVSWAEATSRVRAQEALPLVAKKAQWTVDGAADRAELRRSCAKIREQIAETGPSS